MFVLLCQCVVKAEIQNTKGRILGRVMDTAGYRGTFLNLIAHMHFTSYNFLKPLARC
jgi:hypothetical protein